MDTLNNVLFLRPALDVFDSKNIYNCFKFEVDSDNECRLYIDTSKLSFVNKNILYTIADVYFEIISFGDNPDAPFITYRGAGKKKSFFERHRYACFHIPNFGEDFHDYMAGFYLELANCFVQQEPFLELECVLTKDELQRYKKYIAKGREDQKNISLVVSLSKDNVLRNQPSTLKVAANRFSCGEIVPSHQVSLEVINKNFTLEADRSLNNVKKYNATKDREAKIKSKVSSNYG